LALLALIALLAAPAAAVHAAQRMPIGFFDDPSFRWSPTRAENLQQASATGASVIHTTASWPGLAPTKPADPGDGNDPAYKLGDLDELVYQSGLYGLRVMIDLNGVPPTGIEGVEPTDKGTDRNGIIRYGALVVGGTKMKVHKAAINKLFDTNNAVLDIEEVYNLALQLP